MYVANENLRDGRGSIVIPVGAEVSEDALKSDMAKAYGWKDLVTESRTKTVRATGAGTDKPAEVPDAPMGTANTPK